MLDSVKSLDDFHAPINAQSLAVQGEIIVLGMSPLHIRIEAVIGGTTFVLFPQPLFRGLFPLTVDIDNSLGAKVHVCVDEYP